jgi:hypothetical protein
MLCKKSGPCFGDDFLSLLLAPASSTDIKKALFSIGNDKASGPDGFSSLFFKKSWDVVGGDFVLLFRTS